MGHTVHTVNHWKIAGQRMTIEEYGDEGDQEFVGAAPVAQPHPGVTNWAVLGVKPPPLRPLRYCAFRTDDGPCQRFSSLLLDDLPFCSYHHAQVEFALAEEEKRVG